MTYTKLFFKKNKDQIVNRAIILQRSAFVTFRDENKETHDYTVMDSGYHVEKDYYWYYLE